MYKAGQTAVAAQLLHANVIHVLMLNPWIGFCTAHTLQLAFELFTFITALNSSHYMTCLYDPCICPCTCSFERTCALVPSWLIPALSADVAK